MKITSALQWIGDCQGYLELIDQRVLPGTWSKLVCRDTAQLWQAIKTLAVRGAPAIGVSAAYGLVLALQQSKATDACGALKDLIQQAHYLASSRPTAVNLFWALDRVRRSAEQLVADQAQADKDALLAVVFAEAEAICREDVVMCQRIGEHGERFIGEGCGVLTHCNAGALATAGQGTALSLMFEAHKRGRSFTVYADETRPLLQGARLTACELQRAGIEVKVLCDSMAGWLMKQGKVHAIVTGADRIAANGDAANKIGTYSLSILAREHQIPFYIAAPSSTFDLSIENGQAITIEQRSAEEVTTLQGVDLVPAGVGVYNPAFDVVQASDITALITEVGVIEKPSAEKIRDHFSRSK